MAREEKDKGTIALALVLRVDIRTLLKKNEDAAIDAQEADRLDPETPRTLLAVAQTHSVAGRLDQGILALQKAFGLSPSYEIAYLYGKMLITRGRQSDLELTLTVLTKIPLQDVRQELRTVFVIQTTECFAKMNNWMGAESYLARASDFLDAVVVETTKGYLAHYQGRLLDAERHATVAQPLITTTTNPDAKEYLARLLMVVGRPADALPIWQDLFDLESPAFDPGNLLDCAARLQRDDIVIRTCERLHERGISEWRLIEFETSYLEKYRIEAAIERLQSFLDQHPDNKLARLRLSMIGLRLNRLDLVRSSPEDLPSVEELEVRYAIPAVQVMKFGGHPNEAVDYAYRYLRAHFNEIAAHECLVISMMPGASAPEIPPTLELAGTGAAVCYVEIPHGNPNWVVLESTDSPSGDFEEISLSHPLATELTGKRTGDEFVLAKGNLQNRAARITSIIPKYVRRYQDSISEMQVRFGAASSVESLRVEPAESGNRSEGIAAILASVEERAAAVAQARERYNTQPISLHLYGSPFGQNAYSALLNLAVDEGPIKCCVGSPQERDQAVQALLTAKAVVIDVSALATLRLLGLERLLSTNRFHFITPERAWIMFQEMLSRALAFSAPGGTLIYKNGQHLMYQETAEAKAQRDLKDKEFLELIEKSTEVRSGLALAAIQPDKRDVFEKFLGAYGTEAMVLSSDPDYVLWTDDLIQAQVAAQEFGCRRVWTQLVLGILTDAGLMTPNEFHEASAHLVGMEFVATQFDSNSMIAGARLAGWLTDRSPIAEMLKIFANLDTDLQQLFRIFVEFIIRLYREAVSPETRCLVSRALLDTFARRPQGMVLLTSLRKLTSRTFGMNLIGKEQFEECFDRWLKLRDVSLIVSP